MNSFEQVFSEAEMRHEYGLFFGVSQLSVLDVLLLHVPLISSMHAQDSSMSSLCTRLGSKFCDREM